MIPSAEKTKWKEKLTHEREQVLQGERKEGEGEGRETRPIEKGREIAVTTERTMDDHCPLSLSFGGEGRERGKGFVCRWGFVCFVSFSSDGRPQRR